jgi:hypothetical protein
MKLLRSALRTWITLTSVLSFVGGWVILAHAPKPVQTNSSLNTGASVPTLEPLPPLSSGANSFQDQPLFSVQPSVRARSNPMFITGGS